MEVPLGWVLEACLLLEGGLGVGVGAGQTCLHHALDIPYDLLNTSEVVLGSVACPYHLVLLDEAVQHHG